MRKTVGRMVLPALAACMLVFAIIHVVKAQQTLPKPSPPVEPARTPFGRTVAGAGIVEAVTENISIGTALPGLVMEVYIPVDRVGTPVKRTLVLSPDSVGTLLRLSELEVRPPWRLLESSTRTMRGGLLAVVLTVQFPKTDGSPSGELILHMQCPPGASIRVPLTILGWTPPLPTDSTASSSR